jgi:endonuclease YncB( thermonuclease family)
VKFLFLFVFFTITAHAATYPDLVCNQVVSVYDGDTFKCDIFCIPAIIGDDISIRINGIDTPEMKDKRPEVKELAEKAKQFVTDRVMSAEVIELRNPQRGKYFRIVADVYIDGVNLADELIKAGMAKPYDGGTKEGW